MTDGMASLTAGNLIAAIDGSNNETYYTYDGLGSTTDLSDDDGDVTDTYEYDVFGAVRSAPASSAKPFQFTAQQTDADSGLQYLRARYYDPQSGTFLSRDPLQLQLSPAVVGPGQMPAIMNPQPPSTDESAPRPGTPEAVTNPLALNPYTYGVNNPVNQTDPSGKCSSGLWSFCIGFTFKSSAFSGSRSVTVQLGAITNVFTCNMPCKKGPDPAPGIVWLCPSLGQPGGVGTCVAAPISAVTGSGNLFRDLRDGFISFWGSDAGNCVGYGSVTAVNAVMIATSEGSVLGNEAFDAETAVNGISAGTSCYLTIKGIVGD